MVQPRYIKVDKMVCTVILRQAFDCVAFGILQLSRGVLEIFLQSCFVGITPERVGKTIDGTYFSWQGMLGIL